MHDSNVKPLGIVLIVIFSVLTGLVSLLGGFLSMLLSGIPGISFFAYLLGTLFTAHAVFTFAAVYGLWVLQRWGLKLAFWLYIIAIPLGILAIFPILPGSEFTTANTVFQLIFIVIDFLIILYLGKLDIAILYDAL
ncbi:MAG: hypothetical protein H7A06_08795 [Pseudomonadales bacterium]|nr:hypothetical protein [Pseudomonadales bacterium]